MFLNKNDNKQQLGDRSRHLDAQCSGLWIIGVRHLVLLLLIGRATPSSCATIEEIFSGWNNYDAAVTSAQLHCTFDRIEVLERPPSSKDPYQPDKESDADEQSDNAVPPPEPGTLHRELVVSISGEKLASERNGEVWHLMSQKIVDQERKVGFDGKETRGLYYGSKVNLGEISTGPQPTDTLNNSAEMKPFLLSFFPATFLADKKGVTKASLKIVNQDAEYSGEESMLLESPTGSEGNAIILHVDPNHGYRIQSMEERIGGVKRREIKLSYKDDPAIGWIVSSWVADTFDDKALPFLTINGKVTEYSIGKDIPAETFHPVFPVGTHVNKDGDYYIQQADGLEPLDEDLYGMPPKSILEFTDRGEAFRRIALMLTVTAVIVLGVLVIKKYQAKQTK